MVSEAYKILDWVFAGLPPSSRAQAGLNKLKDLPQDTDVADVATMLTRLLRR